MAVQVGEFPKQSFVISLRLRLRVILGIAMTHFPQPNPQQRATRVKMEATASALVKLEDGQRTKAKLQTVSVTGGLLRLARALGEGDFVEVAFQTQSGPVHGMAEMLHPAADFGRRNPAAVSLHCPRRQ